MSQNPMIYAPEDIDRDFLENICNDLHCALLNMLDNDGDDEEYSKASELLRHIEAVADELNQRKGMNDDSGN